MFLFTCRFDEATVVPSGELLDMKDGVSGGGRPGSCLATSTPSCRLASPVIRLPTMPHCWLLCHTRHLQSAPIAHALTPWAYLSPLQLLERAYEKGQSKRIWGELYKVLDSSDVIVQVSAALQYVLAGTFARPVGCSNCSSACCSICFCTLVGSPARGGSGSTCQRPRIASRSTRPPWASRGCTFHRQHHILTLRARRPGSPLGG